MIMIERDDGSEMMRITKDGDYIVMEGNYWDFPQDPRGYADLFRRLGLEVTEEEYEYDK